MKINLATLIDFVIKKHNYEYANDDKDKVLSVVQRIELVFPTRAR